MKNNDNLNIIIISFGFFIITTSIIFLSNGFSILGSVAGFLIIFFNQDIAKYFRN